MPHLVARAKPHTCMAAVVAAATVVSAVGLPTTPSLAASPGFGLLATVPIGHAPGSVNPATHVVYVAGLGAASASLSITDGAGLSKYPLTLPFTGSPIGIAIAIREDRRGLSKCSLQHSHLRGAGYNVGTAGTRKCGGAATMVAMAVGDHDLGGSGNIQAPAGEHSRDLESHAWKTGVD